MNTVYDILINYHDAFGRGLLVTASLALIVWTGGLVLGVLFGILGHTTRRVGEHLKYWNFFVQSVPVIVVLFWMHYPLQQLLSVSIPPFYTACVVLILVNTVSVSHIIKTALDEFPNQYALIGRVCGLLPYEIIRNIQLPMILRTVLPEILSLEVQVLQMTLFASLISVEELFRVAQLINAQIYKPVEIYTGVALFFMAICLPLMLLASRLKTRYSRDYSET